MRLENAANVKASQKERLNIQRASDLRDQIVHDEFELNKFECKKIFAQLFELVHFFHANHFKREIHVHIAKGHWAVEARLMGYFRKNFVIYNDIEMPKEAPAEIVAAQGRTHVWDGHLKYARIKYGDKAEWGEVDPTYADSPCHDCLVVKGQYHVEGCDMERCPKCGGQFFCCSCGWEPCHFTESGGPRSSMP